MLPRPPAALSLTLSATLLLFLPATAAPQRVALDDTGVVVYNTIGVVAELDSVGDLTLGGNERNGDLFVKTTEGATTINLNGGAGDITVGGGARNGQVYVKDIGGLTTVTLNGEHGNVTLGGGSDDGDLYLRDTNGTTNTIHLNGEFATLRLGHADSSQSGTVEVRAADGTGLFLINGNTGDIYSNQLGSEGLVKAWARIESDGTINSCWRCNSDTGETRRLEAGRYEIDFQLLGDAAGDIRSRPWTCSIGNGTQSQLLGTIFRGISCFIRSDDHSSIHVSTWVFNSDSVDLSDAEFTVVIY